MLRTYHFFHCVICFDFFALYKVYQKHPRQQTFISPILIFVKFNDTEERVTFQMCTLLHVLQTRLLHSKKSGAKTEQV